MHRGSVVLIRDTVLVIFDFTRRNVGMAALEMGVQHVGWRVQLEPALLWVGVGWGGIQVQTYLQGSRCVVLRTAWVPLSNTGNDRAVHPQIWGMNLEVQSARKPEGDLSLNYNFTSRDLVRSFLTEASAQVEQGTVCGTHSAPRPVLVSNSLLIIPPL